MPSWRASLGHEMRAGADSRRKRHSYLPVTALRRGRVRHASLLPFPGADLLSAPWVNRYKGARKGASRWACRRPSRPILSSGVNTASRCSSSAAASGPANPHRQARPGTSRPSSAWAAPSAPMSSAGMNISPRCPAISSLIGGGESATACVLAHRWPPSRASDQRPGDLPARLARRQLRRSRPTSPARSSSATPRTTVPGPSCVSPGKRGARSSPPFADNSKIHRGCGR